MRTVSVLSLACLLLVGSIVGCAPKDLTPAELEAAAVGTWRRSEMAPGIELKADKTLMTESDGQKRGGTWSMNTGTREIVLNIDKSEPINGSSWDAAIWTAYMSKDGTALNYYAMEPSMIEGVKSAAGKDPGTILRKY